MQASKCLLSLSGRLLRPTCLPYMACLLTLHGLVLDFSTWWWCFSSVLDLLEVKEGFFIIRKKLYVISYFLKYIFLNK